LATCFTPLARSASTANEGEIPGDVGEQTRLCFENLRKVLDEAGARFEDVVKVNVYLTDVVKDFDTMNKVYKDYFPSDYPARTAVGIPSLVNPDLKVEVEMIVLLPDKGE